MIKRIGSPMPFVSRQLFGGKGKNLLELGEEFPVPEGFVVSSEIYAEFLVRNNLRPVIEDILAKRNYDEVERKARSAFKAGKFTASVEADLEKHLKWLLPLSKTAQAVRSSGIDEDGSNKSFAGQHDSFFAKLDTASLMDYIKLCYASAFNATAMNYRMQHGLGLPAGMAVVVQDMKQFFAGFVAYSAAPGDYDSVLVESAPGHCKSVVDGRPVDFFRINRRGIESKINRSKNMMWHFDESIGKLVLVPTPSDRVSSPCLTDDQLKEISAVAQLIEASYALEYPSERKPQDIEGGIDYDSKIWVTQSRDITGMSFKAKDIVLPTLARIIGRSKSVGSPGIYDGPVVLIENVDPNGTTFRLKGNADITALDKKYSSGYFIVTPETNPTLDCYLKNCRAIVATECGIMSHAGATARERGLVFVGCVEPAGNKTLQQILSHGENLCVAANKEEGIVGYR